MCSHEGSQNIMGNRLSAHPSARAGGQEEGDHGSGLYLAPELQGAYNIMIYHDNGHGAAVASVAAAVHQH